MKISMILWSILIGLICSQSASALLVDPDPSWMSTTIVCDNIPVKETDWIAGTTPGVNPIEIPLFDPSLGVLKQVDITVENCVYQTAGFENRAITSDSFSTETGAEIYTTLLDGSTQIISIVKEGPMWHTLSAYDGVVDYAGPSGFNYILDRCGTEGHSVLAQADLAAYIGAGETRELPTEAIGYTEMKSAGNVNAQVLTSAGANVCVTYYYVPCDDGVYCNGAETSDGVTCQPGTPVSCDDGAYCNGVETCDEATDSCAPGTPVNCDDGAYCNGVETCDEATDSCAPGTPVNCDNGVYCDGVETCDEATDSCAPGTPVSCDDGAYCNGVETCDEATDSCAPGTPVNCDDGAWCNGAETCDEELGCQPGTAPNCDDGIACTADSCNEQTDSCDHTPDNSYCEDGDVCNGIETCDPVNGCQDGTPLVCDDGDACTTDACDPVLGCQYAPKECDDGDLCTIDSCVNGECVYKPIVCNDNDPCTTDACVDGVCVYTPITNCNCPSKCPWSIKNELYVASCTAVKVVSASEGILANDHAAVAVLEPESISIDPKYGTIEVHEDGSFIYDPTGATGLYNGVYVQFKYRATNGYCEAKYPGTAKMQVVCKLK